MLRRDALLIRKIDDAFARVCAMRGARCLKMQRAANDVCPQRAAARDVDDRAAIRCAIICAKDERY